MLFLLSSSVALHGLNGINNPSPDLISTSLKMVIALVVILAGLLLIGHLTKRIAQKGAGKSKDQLIKVLAHEYIGMKKCISLVEVPGCILVVGISNEHLCLLTKIENEKILEMVKGQEVDNPGTSFLTQLRALSSGREKQDIMKGALRAISRLGLNLNRLQKVRRSASPETMPLVYNSKI
jgi:flagellar biogenesis protein FliO